MTGQSMFVNRSTRVKAAHKEGKVAEPFDALPGSPPALVTEWADKGQAFFLALVNPVSGTTLVRRSKGSIDALQAWLGQPVTSASVVQRDTGGATI